MDRKNGDFRDAASNGNEHRAKRFNYWFFSIFWKFVKVNSSSFDSVAILEILRAEIFMLFISFARITEWIYLL